MLIIGTIEARMGSTRLPGKTLMEVHGGICLLEQVVSRFKLAKEVNDVWVATTLERSDDPIAEWCGKNHINCHRGSENDVLDRVAGAVNKSGADAIVQMGADSAYLDFELVDMLVRIYTEGGYDYVCNDLELTYPLGIYAHVVRASALLDLNRREGLPEQDREDVVRHIWEHPESYRIRNVNAPAELAFPNLRFTIDYPEDMGQARDICELLGKYDFTTPELIDLYRKFPTIFEKTAQLVQRSAPFLQKETHG